MAEVNTKTDGLEEFKGAFVESLTRSNRQIKTDRAISIVEDAEQSFKRRVEDLEKTIKRLKRERDGMLDLSPTNAQSLVLASEFDPEKFTEDYIEYGLKLRNLEIQLEVAEAGYSHLFS
jgi:hypothetical protein